MDLTPLIIGALLRYTSSPVAKSTKVAIGTILGGAGADAALKLWTPDGRLYLIKSGIITKHPEIHLGVGKPLFGALQFRGVMASASSIGTAGAFYTSPRRRPIRAATSA